MYFRQARLSSFQRQLKLYGFEFFHYSTGKSFESSSSSSSSSSWFPSFQHCSGHQQVLRGVAYRHELFVKDHPEYCRRMKRVSGKYKKISPSTATTTTGRTHPELGTIY